MNKPRLTYQPGTSLFHQLHPLVKVCWLVFLTIFVFIAPSLWWVIGLLVMTILVFPVLGIPLSEIRGIRLFLITAALLVILQVIFNNQGDVLMRVGPVEITNIGLIYGAYIGARFLCVIFLSYIFVFSTSPNDLAYGLMQVGLPYRYGFALVTALRFVPIFEREAQTIYQAQLMRGVRYDAKGLRRILSLARQFTLPILVSALRKVDALAVSMEGRSFGRHPTRTYFHPIRASYKDWLAVGALGLSILVVVIV